MSHIKSRPGSAVVGLIGASLLGFLLGAVPVAGPASAAPPTSIATPACTKGVPWDLQHASNFLIPASSGGSIDCHLQQGYANGAVTILQQVINGCYRSPGNFITVDGIFGPQTKSALQAAQREAGTPDDGVYGPNTRRAFVWGGGAWGPCTHLSPNP